MLANSLLAVTLLTLAQSALASPPGCMLGALTGYSNPADIKSVCQDKNLNSNIASACSSGSDATAAIKALADVCGGVSVKIATDVPSMSSMSVSSGSSKPSATSMASGASTATAGASATGAAKVSGSATGTAASAKSTNAAGRLEVGVVAVIAGFAMVL